MYESLSKVRTAAAGGRDTAWQGSCPAPASRSCGFPFLKGSPVPDLNLAAPASTCCVLHSLCQELLQCCDFSSCRDRVLAWGLLCPLSPHSCFCSAQAALFSSCMTVAEGTHPAEKLLLQFFLPMQVSALSGLLGLF